MQRVEWGHDEGEGMGCIRLTGRVQSLGVRPEGQEISDPRRQLMGYGEWKGLEDHTREYEMMP